MSFIPLHVYSGFSYLQSGLTIEKLTSIAKKRGYLYCGLTDNQSLSGIAPFYHEAKKTGFKPVIGMDVKTDIGIITLFVKNEEGYRNLLDINYSIVNETLDVKVIQEHSKGLIAVYPIEYSNLNGFENENVARALYNYTGKFDKTLIGIPYGEEYKDIISYWRQFGEKYDYLCAAFPHIRYENKNDAIVLDIVNAISKAATLENHESEGNSYFISDDDLKSFYTEDEIENSYKIAISCKKFELIEKRGTLLHFENELGLSSEEYLKKVTFEGLKKRGHENESQYIERINYELNIIHRMGYDDYFLIVADYVNFAKNNGIYVGPGRGSGAGSLVSYCLGIVEADPLKFDLLFERFLNPERQSMPDIDVDFSDINRKHVVTYLKQKYGEDRVGHVLTTQTIGAKESLRDIARVYGYKDNEVELIISTIGNDKVSLRENYKTSPQFKRLIDSDPYYLKMVTLASKIEGLPRQAGLHAAGIVLNNEPLHSTLPVSSNPTVGNVACLEKDYLEEQGFLKMDLLGLRNLSIIENCINLVSHYQGINIDPYKLPYEDKGAIELITKNETIGLFQLESVGMKRTIAEVKPSNFEDIAAIEALFRPGPMDSIPSFARRKNGTERITYLTPELEPILKNTYGIIVYQEQIMQIVRSVAGFSYAEADNFRRAISKKDAAKLQGLHDKFIQGCLSNGKSQALANQLFTLIERFANYGFNKSHAVSYAVLTCQMAYLKCHYPKEFYCSILSSMSPEDRKFRDALDELKARGIKISQPDINESYTGFTISGDTLRAPLTMIKGIQSAFVINMIKEREENGKYNDFFEFAARTRKFGLGMPLFIKLITAGCFDSLEKSRASLRATAFAALSYAEMVGDSLDRPSLFEIGIDKPRIIRAEDNLKEDLLAEYETLGMMISQSLFSLHKETLDGVSYTPLSEIDTVNGEFETVGLVKAVKTIITKKGNKQMAFLDLYDDTSDRSFVMFEEAFTNSYMNMKVDNLVKVRARKDSWKEDSYQAFEVIKLGD